jgi:hypothetical protein
MRGGVANRSMLSGRVSLPQTTRHVRHMTDATMLVKGSWEAAAVAFTARLRDTSHPLPTTEELVKVSKDLLDRHANSAVMAIASASSAGFSEYHVPMDVVVNLTQVAARVRQAQYVRDAIENAKVTAVDSPDAAPSTAATASATGSAPQTDAAATGSAVRNNDNLYRVFDAAMRHVSLACQKRARTSAFHLDMPPPRLANAPPTSSPSAKVPGEITLWEAAVSVMCSAHYCGVLQHEYDGPGEDLRINGTSRIWRHFGHAMTTEVVGDGAGRSAWENALTLLAYMTPKVSRDMPPCCGFTTDGDEIAMVRSAEQALNRADRRAEFLSWHRYVRSDDVMVNRHVCRSTAVRRYAQSVVERVASDADATETGRERWAQEQDVCGDVCIVNLLKTVAPNAWGVAAPSSVQISGGVPVVPTIRTGPFVDREWQQSETEIAAIDAALTQAAAPTPRS